MIAGFISDAHGNGTALATGLQVLRERGVENTFFLGDSIGYIPGTAGLEILVNEKIPSLRGNHEAMCLGLCGTGDNAEIYQLPDEKSLTEPQKNFVRALPEQVEIAGEGLLMVHGSPADPTYGYVYPDTDLRAMSGPWKWVVMGHTHRPFVKSDGNTTFVNCGSCAFPRDGIPEGSAAIIDTAAGTAEVIRFDIQKAIDEALRRTDIHPVTRGALEKLQSK